jgi:DNA-binding winged helix-turn-helix (wHTH) protein
MVYVFGSCELDTSRFELRRGGQIQPIEPQVFEVLVVLLHERHRVVSKQELFDQVWGHRFVGESALTSRIKSVRHAVGDDGMAQQVVRTVRGRGYRFVADVAEHADRATGTVAPTTGEAADPSSALDDDAGVAPARRVQLRCPSALTTSSGWPESRPIMMACNGCGSRPTRSLSARSRRAANRRRGRRSRPVRRR